MTMQEHADDAGELLGALRAHAAEIRLAELEKTRRRLGMLAPEQDQAVDALLSAIVDRLLHSPTLAIRQLQREGRAGAGAATVRSVLGLDRARSRSSS
jgi:glutamyl-tRNA reductase